MIDWVQAFDVTEARELIQHPAQARAHTRRTSEGLVAWVGIEPGSSPLRHFNQSLQLVVRVADAWAFEDVDAHDPPAWHAKCSVHCPTARDASTIGAFVDTIAQLPKPTALLVHCTAGRNRSPAVALWVQERYAPLRPEAFAALHPAPCTDPNRTLLRLLRAYGRAHPSAPR